MKPSENKSYTPEFDKAVNHFKQYLKDGGLAAFQALENEKQKLEERNETDETRAAEFPNWSKEDVSKLIAELGILLKQYEADESNRAAIEKGRKSIEELLGSVKIDDNYIKNGNGSELSEDARKVAANANVTQHELDSINFYLTAIEKNNGIEITKADKIAMSKINKGARTEIPQGLGRKGLGNWLLIEAYAMQGKNDSSIHQQSMMELFGR